MSRMKGRLPPLLGVLQMSRGENPDSSGALERLVVLLEKREKETQN
jgi:hypothetical protein